MKKTFTYLFIFFFVFLLSFSLSAQKHLKNFIKVGNKVKLGNRIFFSADDGLHGIELWSSDGTVEGTNLVKDISTGSSSSNPSSFIVFKGEIYFSAFNEVHGVELWKSDGTDAGTVLVKDLKSYEANNRSSTPTNFVIFKDELYFLAADNGYYHDLWKTNGTSASTVKVYSFSPSSITGLTPVGNSLYFIINYNNQLWKTDGTEAGTMKVFADTGDFQLIAEPISLNNELFFISHTTYRQKIRLYKLSAGVTQPLLLKSFEAQTYGSMDIGNFTAVKSELFFSIRNDNASSGNNTDVLWKSNGTPEGTTQVKNFNWFRHLSGSHIQNFKSYKNKLVFSVKPDNYGEHNLWTSDGTESGTVKLSNAAVTTTVPFTESNNSLYFNGNGELWNTDGSVNGTRLYADLNSGTTSKVDQMFDLDGVLFFTADDGNGLSLWNNLPQPEIHVASGYSSLISASTLEFKSKADSIIIKEIKIKNTGKKELSFSDIYVSGSDFYINGNFQRHLLPEQEDTLKVIYFPSKAGNSRGTLTILNNDLNEGKYSIKLEGSAVVNAGNILQNTSIELQRAISFNDSSNTQKIVLDNNFIDENAPIGTLLGKLNIRENPGNHIFSLVSGFGDTDNHAFVLTGNTLKSAKPIDYEQKNTYSIRVGITDSSQSYEQALHISVEDHPENTVYPSCLASTSNLSYALLDVEFIDNQKVFAVGTDGVIIKSENGGKDWVEVNSGIKHALRNIQFTDSNTGYITTNSNAMLKTENGGDDWFLLEPPTNTYPYPSNLYFVNAKVGFVFGDDGFIFRTLDGGKSWSKYRNSFNSFIAGYFLNEQKGFICGRSNTLHKTIDGGENWQEINMSQFGWNVTLSDITFTSAKIGYILGQRGEILKTTDAGESWTKVGTASSDYAIRLYFLNDNEGYVIGGWNSSLIYKTIDGGATWVLESTSIGSSMGISFSKDKRKGCIVGYGTSLGSTSEPGRFILLKESGSNWITKTALYPADFRAAHFTDHNTGYVFGSKNFKTEDGGITWSELNIGAANPIGGCFFVTNEIAFVYSGNELFKTLNSGKLWSKVLTANNTLGFNFMGVYFLDSENGFAFGWSNEIFKTENGGKNWTAVKAPVTYYITSIYFTDANTGYALGNFGDLVKTVDKGKTWTKVHHFGVSWMDNDGIWLHNIYFINNKIGFVTGIDGILFKTTDGGTTWVEIHTGIRMHLMNIKFINELTGYVATNNYGGIGGLYKTVDGGLSWSLVNQSQALHNLGLNENSIYVAGAYGMFTKYSGGNKPTLTGYIKGEQLVQEKTRVDYSFIPNSESSYTWSVEPGAAINYSNNTATVRWDKPGTYKLKVTAYNSCGVAVPREETIIVLAPPTPNIIGNDTISSSNIQEKYYTKYNEDSRYQWLVEGHKNYVTNNNEIIVTWGEKGKGKLEVIETFKESGIRKKATTHITVLNVTGLEESTIFKTMNLYPNPSNGIINFELTTSKREDIEIQIVDITGKLHNTYKFNKSQHLLQKQINLYSLPAGLYLLQIKIGTEKTIRKIIKQ